MSLGQLAVLGCACGALVCCFGCSNVKKQSSVGVQPVPVEQRSEIVQPDSTLAFRHDGMLTIISSSSTEPVTIEYERADTPEKRARGLMYRNSMQELQGMLFLFDDVAPRYMYMKNTYIPLDILFLDNEKKIKKIYQNTQPCSEELLPSISDARYALEVTAGFCERHGVHEGDLLDF